MSYYADGLIGGNLRLEIDNTALLVWSYVNHAGHLSEPERGAYIARVWPTVKQAADFLAGWRDPMTKLVWPANEDDNAPYTQGLQGAGTVFGALRAAAMLARAHGDEASVSAWIARAAELRGAILDKLYVPGTGFVDSMPGTAGFNPAFPTGGPSSWLVWPEHLLDFGDARLQAEIKRNLAVQLDKVRGKGEGGGYVSKVAVSGALALPPGPDRDSALEVAERLARDIGDPDTRYLGEDFINVDVNGDGVADRRVNAVATPHLWAATLVYLIAMAYYAPELFDRYQSALPAVSIPGDVTPPKPPGTGCGCAAGGAGATGVVGMAAVILALRRRRRRSR
jgi:MYXO-CTERM domain-containing protein